MSEVKSLVEIEKIKTKVHNMCVFIEHSYNWHILLAENAMIRARVLNSFVKLCSDFVRILSEKFVDQP